MVRPAVVGVELFKIISVHVAILDSCRRTCRIIDRKLLNLNRGGESNITFVTQVQCSFGPTWSSTYGKMLVPSPRSCHGVATRCKRPQIRLFPTRPPLRGL